MNEIPDRFWSLFRSVNRSTYIEALLKINEEYEYSNYFLSREVCIQLLSEYFSQKNMSYGRTRPRMTGMNWNRLPPGFLTGCCGPAGSARWMITPV